MINRKCSKCGNELPLNTKYFKPNIKCNDGYEWQCRECVNKKRRKPKPQNDGISRICARCKTEKPLTSEFWHRDSRKRHGFMHVCKECACERKRKFPKKLTAKEGFKFCSKCKKEYPTTLEYFTKDSKQKSGLSPACKFCVNKTPISKREGFKICIRCSRELPKSREYFGKNRSSSDGFLGYCKECDGKSFTPKQRFLPVSNKNGYKICSKCGNEFLLNEINYNISKQSRDGFSNVCKECRKAYLQANKEHTRQKYRLYRQKNKDILNIRKQKRNTAKRNLVSNFSVYDWNVCLEYFDYSCSYCGEKSSELQQEHFIPIVRGGGYTKGNIIPACKSCNCSKGDRNFFKWYPKQPFYSKERECKILQYLDIQKDLQKAQ